MRIFLDSMYQGVFLSLMVLSLFLLASYGLGTLFNRQVLKFRSRTTPTAVIVDIVLGFDLLALLTLGFGAFGLLNSLTVWILLGIFAFAGGFYLTKRFLKSKLLFIHNNAGFCILLAGVAVLTLGSALCFPYAWDEQTYHIAVPFRWINSGFPAVFADNPYSGFPLLPQLLFYLGIYNGGILFPRLLVWAAYLLVFISVYLYFKPYARRSLVLFITFMFLANPLIISMMRSTYIEVFIMLNMLAALLALRETKISGGTVFLCGLLAGSIVATKLTGIGIAAIIFMFLWSVSRQDFSNRNFRLLIYFVLGGIAMALPFYLRPWLLTGNPFYPFLASCFGGTEAEVMAAKYHYLMGGSHFGLRSILGFFTVFILVAFDDKSFDGMTLGWVFIGLLGLSLYWMRNLYYSKKSDRINKIHIPAAIIFYYIFWFMTSQQVRFLQPFLFLVLLTALYALRDLGVKVQKNMMIVLMLAWLMNFFFPPVNSNTIGSSKWMALRHFYVSWRGQRYLPGHSLEFLQTASRDTAYFEAMKALAAKTPADSKVMLIYERRGLYCPRRFVIGTPYFQPEYNTPLPASSELLYKSLVDNSIKYIIWGGTKRNPDELGGGYIKAEEELMGQFLHLVSKGRLEILWGGGDYFLYRVR